MDVYQLSLGLPIPFYMRIGETGSDAGRLYYASARIGDIVSQYFAYDLSENGYLKLIDGNRNEIASVDIRAYFELDVYNTLPEPRPDTCGTVLVALTLRL